MYPDSPEYHPGPTRRASLMSSRGMMQLRQQQHQAGLGAATNIASANVVTAMYPNTALQRKSRTISCSGS